jgi:hypothetical protein
MCVCVCMYMHYIINMYIQYKTATWCDHYIHTCVLHFMYMCTYVRTYVHAIIQAFYPPAGLPGHVHMHTCLFYDFVKQCLAVLNYTLLCWCANMLLFEPFVTGSHKYLMGRLSSFLSKTVRLCPFIVYTYSTLCVWLHRHSRDCVCTHIVHR